MAIVSLNVRNSANLTLLRGFVQHHPQVEQVVLYPQGFDHTVDLLVVDLPGLQSCRRELSQWRNQVQPVIFPVLLLLQPTELPAALPLIQPLVDETIVVPVHKWELGLRLTMLLRLRTFSLTLKESYDRECELRQNLQQANQYLNELAHRDGLTQVANRWAFDQTLSQEWARLAREGQPLALVLCDVDYFKIYNDTYGHPAGDRCLRQVAQVLERNIKRPADLVARYGGEEFVLLLPGTDELGAKRVVESVSQDLSRCQIPHEGSKVSEVLTLSYGIACQVPLLQFNPSVLVQQADDALYQAKIGGRNRYYCSHNSSFTNHWLVS